MSATLENLCPQNQRLGTIGSLTERLHLASSLSPRFLRPWEHQEILEQASSEGRRGGQS